MFFIFGINSGNADLGFRRCFFPCCGIQQGILTYSFQQFTLFFIPLFRFSKQYFISCPNCGAVYELTANEGRRLEKDASAEADPDAIHLISRAYRKFCTQCGCALDVEAHFCPNCGTKL